MPVYARGPSVEELETTAKVQSLIALARAFKIPDNSAGKIAEVEQQYRSSVRNGDLGTRYNQLCQRLATTQQDLAAAKSALEQAEAAHFAALGGTDDGQVESCRTAVLAHSNKVQIVTGEVETLQRLVDESKADLNAEFRSGLNPQWRQFGENSTAAQQAAIDQLFKLVSEPAFVEQLTVLFNTARISSWCGPEGHNARQNTSRYGLV